MVSEVVSAFGVSATTLWIAVFLVAPHKPLPNNEVQELVYARLLGRQQRVILLAVIVTAVAFLALIADMPHRTDALADTAPRTRHLCNDLPMGQLICYTLQPTGIWVTEQLQPDGIWHIVGASASPPVLNEPNRALDPG